MRTTSLSANSFAFALSFGEDPHLIGNQEGEAQAKTNSKPKRKRKEEKRCINLLKSIITLFNNNLFYTKNAKKSNGSGDCHRGRKTDGAR
jgi:CRISPR/Cas system-associated protein Cas7 (RAMP superfamily)